MNWEKLNEICERNHYLPEAIASMIQQYMRESYTNLKNSKLDYTASLDDIKKFYNELLEAFPLNISKL